MEINYNQLEKEFDKKVKELKKICKHKNLSPWSEEWWAMGHSTGFEVKVCKRCRKIIKRRTACMNCGKVVEDYIDGDGKTRAMGEHLCKKCDAIKKQEDKIQTTKEQKK